MGSETPMKSNGASSTSASPSKQITTVTTTSTTKTHQPSSAWGNMSSIKMFVLIILCLQNTVYTLLRRYSQGILKETYSKYEVLMFGEIIKMIFSAYMIVPNTLKTTTVTTSSNTSSNTSSKYLQYLLYIIKKSWKMIMLALIYGTMNILSFVALRNISAGTFTIFAQTKILTTATFSTLLLKKKYSWVKWRALILLCFGVLLFTEHIWNISDEVAAKENSDKSNTMILMGTIAVITEVTLSGFASIYFEKVIKTDPEQLTIWERNFQLAFGSIPVYLTFICVEGGGEAGFGGGWSYVTWILALLGAAGGLLVALAIKHGDSVVKTLATTSAIVLSAAFDNIWLDGPLTPIMIIGGFVVIISIFNYAFDPTPAATSATSAPKVTLTTKQSEDNLNNQETKSLIITNGNNNDSR